MSAPRVTSWGHYPPLLQDCHDIEWRDEIRSTLDNFPGDTTLVFGNGRSYGDVCLAESGRVVRTRGLDRWLAADWSSGRITVESGMRLIEVLRLAIPRGWFLPVVPGTLEVTVGGAVANDVHGKNHHGHGTFGRHVLALDLHRSDRGDEACSAEHLPELFAATIGGLGLTGIITAVTLQLKPIQSSEMNIEHRRFAELAEFFQISQELDQHYEYTAAWLDCKSTRGRGVFTAANHCDDGPLQVDEPQSLSVPFTMPFSAINPLTLGPLNAGWYRTHRDSSSRGSYRPFMFPLDGIGNWNRLYGRRGFQQYQCVIPEQHAEPAMQEILRQISRSGCGSFLSVLKRCGDLRSPGLLSFPLCGTSLALDFPQGDALKGLFSRLDRLVVEANGRLYPAKDAHMSAADFQRMYPAWKALEALRDPMLMSHYWRRVTTALEPTL